MVVVGVVVAAVVIVAVVAAAVVFSQDRRLNCQKGVGVHCNRSLHQYGPEPRSYVTETS